MSWFHQLSLGSRARPPKSSASRTSDVDWPVPDVGLPLTVDGPAGLPPQAAVAMAAVAASVAIAWRQRGVLVISTGIRQEVDLHEGARDCRRHVPARPCPQHQG